MKAVRKCILPMSFAPNRTSGVAQVALVPAGTRLLPMVRVSTENRPDLDEAYGDCTVWFEIETDDDDPNIDSRGRWVIPVFVDAFEPCLLFVIGDGYDTSNYGPDSVWIASTTVDYHGQVFLGREVHEYTWHLFYMPVPD